MIKHFRFLCQRGGVFLACCQLFLGVWLTACSTTNSADAMAEAKAAYQSQDYVLSYQKVAVAARAGDADAQYALGYMMYYGKGTAQAMSAAYDWFQKAAAQGQPQAVQALTMIREAAKVDAAEQVSPKPVPVKAVQVHAQVQAKQPQIKTQPKLNSQPKAQTQATPTQVAVVPAKKVAARGIKTAPAAPAAQQAAAVFHKPQAASRVQQVSGAHLPAKCPAVLLKRPANHFVLQLMGASDRSLLVDRLQRHPLPQALIMQTQRQGTPWYVLLQGDYPSRQTATASGQMLAKQLGTGSTPWVQSVATWHVKCH